MATRVAVDDDEQQIQDLIKEMRRLRSRLATTAVTGTHDEFTAAATPSTTYTLTYIPLSGTCLMALNGHVQREGVDYTVDSTTGVVTVSATQASGDKITFRYLVTDWLVARSLPEDVGGITDNFNRANSTTTANPASDGNTWTETDDSLSGWLWGISSNRLYLPTTTTGWVAGGTAGTNSGPGAFSQNPVIRHDLGSAKQDITVDITMPNDVPHTLIFLNFDPTPRGGYFLDIGGGTNTGTLYRASDNTGGSRTTVGTVSFGSWPFPAGTKTIRIRHDGVGGFQVWENGTSLGTMTDGSPLTGTWMGLSTNVSTVFFDNLSALPV